MNLPSRPFKFPDTPFMLQQCIHRDCHSRSLEQAWDVVFWISKMVPEHCEQLVAAYLSFKVLCFSCLQPSYSLKKNLTSQS